MKSKYGALVVSELGKWAILVILLLVLLSVFLPIYSNISNSYDGLVGKSFSQDQNKRADELFDTLADYLEVLNQEYATAQSLGVENLCYLGRFLYLPEQKNMSVNYYLTQKRDGGDFNYYLIMRSQNPTDPSRHKIIKEKKLNIDFILVPMVWDSNQAKYIIDLRIPQGGSFGGIIFWYNSFSYNDEEVILDNQPFAYLYVDQLLRQSIYITNKFPTFYLHPDNPDHVLLDPPGQVYTPSTNTIPINGLESCTDNPIIAAPQSLGVN